MKRGRLSWVTGALCVLALTASAAHAQDPACTSTDTYCVSTNDRNAGSGNPLVDVTKMLPGQGIFAVGPGNPPDLTKFYVFYDLDEANFGPLSGYVGISMKDLNKSLLGLDGAAVGNFNRDGGNAPLDSLIGGASPSPLALPALPEVPSLGDVAGPLLIELTGSGVSVPNSQDTTPTTLSNALPHFLTLPTR